MSRILKFWKKKVSTKQFWKSKTFYAGVIVFICGGLAAIGIDIPVEIILMLLGLEGYFIRSGMKK